ncbi:ABC transporter permease [Myxococcus sp. CA051A]|uniref:Transport permease protein n=1 Tax=Myxococcus llanfairpwllgwyngyllgogerychwyrndrobwllllantysiliogogogochensis TaxID=2590453 RepID=A0A540WKD3_9BACT|nr:MULTISPECIES: ABC transporter permease [Myxococcus]NTX01612.1 ABC transporter permease [Myxococcus sp. CA040A]NTX16252.1 ABC transporter permease [Myxococcus sp. CA056]NTX40167.1 ABC transporter permease [Myxococcus sp. CA033]NTX54264.1 ABC transporter permease [Myxococcus sp. CA039A]NTX62997.1 ABC transporter permease [Myxococcus sp. CA051A]
MIRLVRELYQYRGLLLSLVQRELKARYRGSFLGFLWTFLNPTLHMLVYALLFTVVMRASTPNYSYFMFVGLLPWIWFSSSLGAGASAISDRRDLMTKVRFPAQVLPTTVVLTNLSNYLLSLPLMVGLGLFHGQVPTWHVIAFPVVVLIQLIFTLAMTYILAAINVTFRDLQHIVGNILTMWFFTTPVLYQASTILDERVRTAVLVVNPMSSLMLSYQAIFYEHRLPDPLPLAALALFSLALLWGASILFESRREEFAESI